MRYQIIIIIVLLLIPVTVVADIVVVVHPSNSIKELTRRQVVDLYMGRTSHFPNGQQLKRYDQPNNSSVRAEFYFRMTQRPIAAINAYWARLRFTGRASPPRVVSDHLEILEIVEKNPDAIGYLKKKHLNDRVTVVLEL